MPQFRVHVNNQYHRAAIPDVSQPTASASLRVLFTKQSRRFRGRLLRKSRCSETPTRHCEHPARSNLVDIPRDCFVARAAPRSDGTVGVSAHPTSPTGDERLAMTVLRQHLELLLELLIDAHVRPTAVWVQAYDATTLAHYAPGRALAHYAPGRALAAATCAATQG
jgi:hypothetical protein